MNIMDGKQCLHGCGYFVLLLCGKKKKKVMVLYFPKDNVSKGSMKCLYIIRDHSCPALAVLSLTYTVCQ